MNTLVMVYMTPSTQPYNIQGLGVVFVMCVGFFGPANRAWKSAYAALTKCPVHHLMCMTLFSIIRVVFFSSLQDFSGLNRVVRGSIPPSTSFSALLYIHPIRFSSTGVSTFDTLDVMPSNCSFVFMKIARFLSTTAFNACKGLIAHATQHIQSFFGGQVICGGAL